MHVEVVCMRQERVRRGRAESGEPAKRRTVGRLVVHKEAQLSLVDAIPLHSDAFALLPDLAQQREVLRAEVAEGADGAVLREDEEVQRRHRLLVPLPVCAHGCLASAADA